MEQRGTKRLTAERSSAALTLSSIQRSEPDHHEFANGNLKGVGRRRPVRQQNINLVMTGRSRDDARKEKERRESH